MGVLTGLCYADVIEVIKLWEVENPLAVLEDLQVMEVKAMEILNKEKK